MLLVHSPCSVRLRRVAELGASFLSVMFSLTFEGDHFSVERCFMSTASKEAKSYVDGLRELVAFVVIDTVHGDISSPNSAHCSASFLWQGARVFVRAEDVETAALAAVALWIHLIDLEFTSLVSFTNFHPTIKDNSPLAKK